MKLLFLILSSDHYLGSTALYSQLQAIWRSYIHSDPEHIEAYFMHADPTLPTEFEIRGDVVWCQTEDILTPGAINKMILSLECFSSRFNEFDYIIRSSLSGFYVLPRFYTFLSTLPKQGCYCGVGDYFASGCGTIFSPDVATVLVENKSNLLNHTTNLDDVAIGLFLRTKGIGVIPGRRLDFFSVHDWLVKQHHIPNDEFHFRVKNHIDERRLVEDIAVMNALILRFYCSGTEIIRK